MSSELRLLGKFAVKDGKIDQFKELFERVMKNVQASEPGTLAYELFSGESAERYAAIEIYRDSAALLAHLENMSEFLGEISNVATISEVELYGEPSSDLRQSLEPFGTKFFGSWRSMVR